MTNKLASDAEVAVFKSWLTDLLRREDVVEIQFVKADGTDRVMQCTLNETKLPERPPLVEGADPKPVKKENPNLISVYDTEAASWRSFKIDSIKKLTLSLID